MAGLNEDIIANSELCFDVLGCAKSDNLSVRHDADSVSQFISFFDMLCAHNN